MLIFENVYDGESMYDIERHVMECFDANYNGRISQIPVDDHGVLTGNFKVTIEWVSN